MSTDSCGCGGTPACQIAEGGEVFDRKTLVAEKMKKMRELSPSKRGRKLKGRSKKE